MVSAVTLVRRARDAVDMLGGFDTIFVVAALGAGLGVVMALIGCGGDDAPDAGSDAALVDADTRDGGGQDSGAWPAWPHRPPAVNYDEAVFQATHNSYSGGTRGSLIEQLDLGVRFLELDIQDDLYADEGDFRVGHGFAGDQVAVGNGNPMVLHFAAWLGVIADWSLAHGDHAPITLGLDLKDDLSDNVGESNGDLIALNGKLVAAFGSRLYGPTDLASGPWPSVESMRGKIVVVLSGSETSRLAYATSDGSVEALAFVEMQTGNDPLLAQRFYAARGGRHDFAAMYRGDGRLVRLWRFTIADAIVDPPVNFPATDTPAEAWYQAYAADIGAVH